MRSPVWAWLRLATAALYCSCRAVSSRSSPESTISFSGVAWIELSRVERLPWIVALSSAMNFSRSSIGASSAPSSVRGAAALPSASGSARAARCWSTRPCSAAMRFCRIRTWGLVGL